MRTKTGLVKWFDAVKGFGFILADDGGPDILLHANVLRNFGHSSIVENARIEVEVTETQRGDQAVEILSVELPEVSMPESLAAIGEFSGTVDFDPNADYVPGRVKWFDKAKGFGFVNLFQSTEDVFVHMEVLRSYGMSDLEQGEAVCVRTAIGERGRMAVEIRPWDYAAMVFEEQFEEDS